MLPKHSNKIGDHLRDMGVLSSVDIMRIVVQQERTAEPFGQIAIFWKLATPEQICEAWARQLAAEQRHVDLERFGVDPWALEQLTPLQARTFRALPLRCWGSHLVVALVTMPLDGITLQEISRACGGRYVYPCYCSAQQFDQCLDKYYPLLAGKPARLPG